MSLLFQYHKLTKPARRKLKSKLPLFTGIFALSLSACVSTPKVSPVTEVTSVPALEEPKANIAHLSAEQRGQLYFNIILAGLAHKEQQLGIAQNNYLDAAERTKSPQLAKKASQIALLNNDYQQAQSAADIWQQADNNAAGPYKIGLLKALYEKNPEQAQKQLSLLISKLDKSPDNQLLTLSQVVKFYKKSPNLQARPEATVGQLLADVKEYETSSQQAEQDLIKLFATYNASKNATAATYSQEALIRLQSKQNKQQLKKIHQQLDKSLQMIPNFITAIELKAETYALQSEQKRDQYLQQILEQELLSTQQLKAFASIAYQQKNYPTAVLSFKRLLEIEPNNLRVQFLLAASYYATEQYKSSNELFWRLALQEYRQQMSSFYCAETSVQLEDLAKTISCYQMVPTGRYFYQARTRLAQIFADNQQLELGIETLRQAQSMVDFNEQQRFLLFEINYLLDNQQYSQAKLRLKDALTREPNNVSIYFLQFLLLDKTQPVEILFKSIKQTISSVEDKELRKELVIMSADLLRSRNLQLESYQLLAKESVANPQDLDLLYAKALSAEPLGYYLEMEKDLRFILSQDPQHNDARNALGYTLADLNTSLNEALTLIEGAFKIDPKNSAIQDSMGWVHYRLGNLQKALKFLQLSYQSNPAPEVAAHLGEVLWKLQRTKQATEIWRKALQNAPQNQYILRTLGRFPEANIDP